MSKRVVLVGHCSPDSSYLCIAVKSVLPGAHIERANSDAALSKCLASGADLLLVNRQLDGDFSTAGGVEMIAACVPQLTSCKWLLVSNYADAQARAVKAGALPGFGKSELNTKKTRDALATALGGSTL